MAGTIVKLTILGAVLAVALAGVVAGMSGVIAAGPGDATGNAAAAQASHSESSAPEAEVAPADGEPVRDIVVPRDPLGGLAGIKSESVRLESPDAALAHVLDTLPDDLVVESSAVRLITLRDLDAFNESLTNWSYLGVSPDDGTWLVAIIFEDRLSTDAVAMLPNPGSARGVVLALDPRDGWRWSFGFIDDDLSLYHRVEEMEDTTTQIPDPYPSGQRPFVGATP